MMMRSQWFTKVIRIQRTLRKRQRDLENPKFFLSTGATMRRDLAMAVVILGNVDVESTEE